MKKILGILAIAAIAGFVFFGPQKGQIKFEGVPEIVKQQLPKSVTNLFGQSSEIIEKQVTKYYPQKVIEDTARYAAKKVSSDAQEVVLGVSTSFVVNQFVNTYKSLSPEAKKEVRGAICR